MVTQRLWKLMVVGAASALAVACTHSATETTLFESVASPTDRLRIETEGGEVIVEADPSVTQVTGTVRIRARGFEEDFQARDAVKLVRIVESGPPAALTLSLSTPVTSGFERFEADFILRVPPGITISAFTDDERVAIVGLPVLDLRTDDDVIELTNTSGNAKLRNDRGKIDVVGHVGSIDARTNRAEIHLHDIAGNVVARTSESMIFASITPPVYGEVVLSTSNSGIDLAVPFDWGALVQARTTEPGALNIVDLDWWEDVVAPGLVTGQLWDGRGVVDVETSAADIVLRRF